MLKVIKNGTINPEAEQFVRTCDPLLMWDGAQVTVRLGCVVRANGIDIDAANIALGNSNAIRTSPIRDGKYVVIGFKVGEAENPYHMARTCVINPLLYEAEKLDRSVDGFKRYFETHPEVMGIRFYDGIEPKCEVDRRDLGFNWPEEVRK